MTYKTEIFSLGSYGKAEVSTTGTIYLYNGSEEEFSIILSPFQLEGLMKAIKKAKKYHQMEKGVRMN